MEKSPKEKHKLHDLDRDTTIQNITAILTEIISENMDSSKTKLREAQKNTTFFSKKIPSINIQAYFERIIKYSKMEETTLVVVLIYIDKLCESNNFLLTENNIHRYVYLYRIFLLFFMFSFIIFYHYYFSIIIIILITIKMIIL